jgi:hypothetical protein
MDAMFATRVTCRLLDTVEEFGVGVIEATDFHEAPLGPAYSGEMGVWRLP